MIALADYSPAQLAEAAVLARACQLIQAAIDYGLIEGGPAIDMERCDEVLAFVAERDVDVSDADAERAAIDLVRELAGAPA